MESITILKIVLVALMCLPMLWLLWVFFWKLYDEMVRKTGEKAPAKRRG